MQRLTQKDPQGNWNLKGVLWNDLHEGRVITKELWEKLYGALWRLMEYEDTGLSPVEVEDLKEAIEKQQSKKPNYEGDGYAPDGTFVWDEWLCPNCESRYEVDYEYYDYCPNCGQRIDWSE